MYNIYNTYDMYNIYDIYITAMRDIQEVYWNTYCIKIYVNFKIIDYF